MNAHRHITIRIARRPSRAGLTFLEFLIAISITAVTSLAVGVITTSIARGMTSMNDARSALQRSLVAHARFQSQMIPAYCALEFDQDKGFVVWQNDARPDGKVNLSEYRVFWFDPDTDGDVIMEWVTFPDGWDDDAKAAADIVLTGVDDYFDTMATQRALGYTTQSVIADSVSAVSVAGEGIDLPNSARIRIELTINVGEDDPEQILMAFGLVNHTVPE